MFLSTASANYDEQESQIVIEVSPQDCQVLTQDEYINDLVITQNLTPEQAIQKAEEDYKKINQISPRSQLAKYTDTISAGPYEVLFGVYIIIEDGSLPVFLGVGEVWSQATGVGNYTWNEGSVQAYYISNKRVQLVGDGVIEVEYTHTLESNFGISIDDLISWGFSEATSTQTYFRKQLSCNTFFKPWWA